MLKTYVTIIQVSISHKQEVTEPLAFSRALDIFAINILCDGPLTMLQVLIMHIVSAVLRLHKALCIFTAYVHGDTESSSAVPASCFTCCQQAHHCINMCPGPHSSDLSVPCVCSASLSFNDSCAQRSNTASISSPCSSSSAF